MADLYCEAISRLAVKLNVLKLIWYALNSAADCPQPGAWFNFDFSLQLELGLFTARPNSALNCHVFTSRGGTAFLTWNQKMRLWRTYPTFTRSSPVSSETSAHLDMDYVEASGSSSCLTGSQSSPADLLHF